MIASVSNSLSRRILTRRPDRILRSSPVEVLTRSFGVANKGPHPDPLHMWQQECTFRQLCDTHGNRLPGVDWRITVAIANADKPEAVRRTTLADKRVAPGGWQKRRKHHSTYGFLNTLFSLLFIASQPENRGNRTYNSGRY